MRKSKWAPLFAALLCVAQIFTPTSALASTA